ncbi:MAG: hypothetical protein HN416_10365 [Nitrospina sp.]|nr:hypothetical protein [Nitrospina sp.]
MPQLEAQGFGRKKLQKGGKMNMQKIDAKDYAAKVLESVLPVVVVIWGSG